MVERIWYVDRYIDHQLNGENIYKRRIRERSEDMPESGSDRIVAKGLTLKDAERICAAVNPVLINV